MTDRLKEEKRLRREAEEEQNKADSVADFWAQMKAQSGSRSKTKDKDQTAAAPAAAAAAAPADAASTVADTDEASAAAPAPASGDNPLPPSGPTTAATTTTADTAATARPAAVTKTPAPGKVIIKKAYDFAGETVVVEKEVDAGSRAAKAAARAPVAAGSGKGKGLASVLARIGKKKKMSTMDKSELDWKQYRTDNNLEDELKLARTDGYAVWMCLWQCVPCVSTWCAVCLGSVTLVCVLGLCLGSVSVFWWKYRHQLADCLCLFFCYYFKCGLANVGGGGAAFCMIAADVTSRPGDLLCRCAGADTLRSRSFCSGQTVGDLRSSASTASGSACAARAAGNRFPQRNKSRKPQCIILYGWVWCYPPVEAASRRAAQGDTGRRRGAQARGTGAGRRRGAQAGKAKETGSLAVVGGGRFRLRVGKGQRLGRIVVHADVHLHPVGHRVAHQRLNPRVDAHDRGLSIPHRVAVAPDKT